MKAILSISFFIISSCIVLAQPSAIIKNKSYKGFFDGFFKNNPKIVKLKIGKKIIYETKGNKKKKEGVITNITDTTIVINKVKYTVNKIDFISIKSPNGSIKMLVAPIIIGSGLGLAASGGYFAGYAIYHMIHKTYFVFRVIPITLASVAVGLGSVALGTEITIKGIKLFGSPFANKDFKLKNSKNWELLLVDKSEIKEIKKSIKRVKKTKKKKNTKKK